MIDWNENVRFQKLWRKGCVNLPNKWVNFIFIFKFCKETFSFQEKFTQLEIFLHDRQSRRSRQNSSLLAFWDWYGQKFQNVEKNVRNWRSTSQTDWKIEQLRKEIFWSSNSLTTFLFWVGQVFQSVWLVGRQLRTRCEIFAHMLGWSYTASYRVLKKVLNT